MAISSDSTGHVSGSSEHSCRKRSGRADECSGPMPSFVGLLLFFVWGGRGGSGDGDVIVVVDNPIGRANNGR